LAEAFFPNENRIDLYPTSMKILLGLIAILSLSLVSAPAETAKERAHQKAVAEAPPTENSEALAAQQIDKSYSSLKAALAGMIKSRKKGDLNAFALYKQQAIDMLNLLSKQASLAINTETAEKAIELKSGMMPAPIPTPTPEATVTPEPTPTPTPEATVTPEPTPTPTPEATVTPEPTPTPTPEATVTPEPTSTPTPEVTVTPEPTPAPTPEATVTPESTPEATVTPEPTATPQ
jgi:hypothetical protein